MMTYRDGIIHRAARPLGGILLLVFLLTGGLSAGLQLPVQAAESSAATGERYITIDFNDVDISLFIKYISELTGKNFIVDRTVKGKVTIISPTRISERDAYHVFESVLEVHGFTTVPSGSVIKIIPSVQARAKSIETIREAGTLYPDDRVVTQLIPLTHTSPDEMKRLLAPLVSKTSVVIAHTDSGMLIITDFLSNIKRLQEIIDAVDVPSIGEELVVLPLQYASAANISKAVSQLFIKAARKGQRPETIKLIPYERTNSLIVFASRANIQKVRSLLAKIDTPAPKGKGKIQVYYLQHANAKELADVLTKLPEAKKSGGAAGATAGTPLVSKNVKVMADEETNSLIIIGPHDEYLVMEEVIRKLDIPRRMVYIEALIMEVSVSKQFEVGVQWAGGAEFDNGTGIGFGGFGAKTDPLAELAESSIVGSDNFAMPAGFTVGVIKQGIKIGNVFFPNLAAILKAYQDDSDVEIIATPQILTTDNKEAEIKVGENVPYITSQQQNSASVNVGYNQYEYKDVGTTLTLTPQINQSDLVRLDIFVEVSKVKTQVGNTPTTLKRTAKTTVVVRNEETVVMGGIIGQDTSSGEYKVPLLGDIPLIGWLFKTRNERVDKTNLFIFLTPHIVENPAELASLYYKKRDVMEYVKEGSSAIPDFNYRKDVDPAHAVALVDIGFTKLERKDYHLARQYFEQALKIDPNNPYAMLNLGVVCEREGKRDEAARYYRMVIGLTPPVLEGTAGKKGEDGEEIPAEPDPRFLELQQRAADNLKRMGMNSTNKPVTPPPTPAAKPPVLTKP